VTITPAKRNKAKQAMPLGQQKKLGTKAPVDDLGTMT